MHFCCPVHCNGLEHTCCSVQVNAHLEWSQHGEDTTRMMGVSYVCLLHLKLLQTATSLINAIKKGSQFGGCMPLSLWYRLAKAWEETHSCLQVFLYNSQELTRTADTMNSTLTMRVNLQWLS